MNRKATTEELWRSYQELGSLAAVAERHGYTDAAPVSRRFRRAGYKTHPKHVRIDDRYICPIEEVVEAFRRTRDYRETARLVSSTPAAVKHRLARIGIRKGTIQ